jgi:hypothetical protein
MSEDFKYCVIPFEQKYEAVSLTEKEKSEVRGLGGAGGCAVWGLVSLALIVGVSALAASLGVPYRDW